MDIARLGIEVKHGTVDSGSKSLDRLTRAGADAERSMGKVGKTSTRAGRQVAAANDNMSRSTKRSSRAFAALRKTAVSSLLAIAGGITAVTLTMRKFIGNTVQAQAVQAQLAATIASTGGAAGKTVDDLNKTAAAMQRITNYGDEVTNAAQGILLTFRRIKGDEFDRATMSVLDTATALKTDLKSAAIQIGKALDSPVQGMTALSRSGIVFTNAQKDVVKQMVATGNVAEAQRLILRELETQFGGSAEAARKTLGGALTSLGNAFGDLFELSGPAAELFRKSIERLIEAISDPGFVAFVQMLGTILMVALVAVTEAFNVLASVVSFVGNNLDVAGVAVGTFGSLMLAALSPSIIMSIVAAFKTLVSTIVGGMRLIAIAMMANPLGLLIAAITAVITAAYVFRDEIKQIFGVDLIGLAKNAFNFVVGVGVGAFNAIKETWSILPSVFGDLAYSAANKFNMGIADMLQGSATQINLWIKSINRNFGTEIGTINNKGFHSALKIKNPYAGSASKAAGIAGDEFSKALGRDYIGEIGAYLSKPEGGSSGVPSLNTDIEETGKKLDGAKGKASKAGKAIKDAATGGKDKWKGLRETVNKAAEEMKKAGQDLGNSLGGIFRGLLDKTMTWKDAAMAAFKSVLKYLNSSNVASGGSGLFGGGFIQSLVGGFLGLSFDGGGKTPSGPRTGGLDGKGGMAAMVHPNETIVDHTKRSSTGGSFSSLVDRKLDVYTHSTISVDDDGKIKSMVDTKTEESEQRAVQRADQSMRESLPSLTQQLRGEGSLV